MHLGDKFLQLKHFSFLTKQVAKYFFVTYLQINSQYSYVSHFLAFEQLVELWFFGTLHVSHL